jgi:hypothetical protein
LNGFSFATVITLILLGSDAGNLGSKTGSAVYTYFFALFLSVVTVSNSSSYSPS